MILGALALKHSWENGGIENGGISLDVADHMAVVLARGETTSLGTEPAS